MTEAMDKKKQTFMKSMRKYVLYFMMYAMFGWFYEVFLEVVVYRWGFSDRGILLGPYCPVYGFGAMVFLFCVYPLIKNKKYPQKLLWIVPVFLGCMASATLLELITSYLLEWTTGTWQWKTYEDYAINFQARIALSPSVRFGIGGVVFLYLLQPLFEKVVNKINDYILTIISVGIFVLLIADLVYTIFFR